MAETTETTKTDKAPAPTIAMPNALTIEFAKKNFNRPDELFKKVIAAGGYGDLGDNYLGGYPTLDLTGVNGDAKTQIQAIFAEHAKAGAADSDSK